MTLLERMPSTYIQCTYVLVLGLIHIFMILFKRTIEIQPSSSGFHVVFESRRYARGWWGVPPADLEVHSGRFPQALPELCRRYWCMRQHLSIDDDLIVCGCQLLIPTTLYVKGSPSHVAWTSPGLCVNKGKSSTSGILANEIDNVALAPIKL